MKRKVVAIVGPTSSGKTALSLRLAERMPAEIVACDSRTVFRYFDIGTAKPSAEERAAVPHHLIDVADPTDFYTVAEYREQSTHAIEQIHSANKTPFVVGGTGFYARALLEGLVMPKVGPQPQLRAELEAFADAEGNPALHARLQEIDPTTAARVNINDRFRMIRALEVSITSGEPFSTQTTREDPPYDTVWIGLTLNDRAYLDDLIKRRFDIQLQQGLVEEVETLYKQFGASQSVMSTVAYKELVEYVQGKTSLPEAVDLAMLHTRQLARKQLIWFRSNPLMKWFAIDEHSPDELATRVLQHIETKFGDSQ